jgi:hypothetical protein
MSASAATATALTNLSVPSVDQSPVNTRVTGITFGDDLSSELLAAATARLQNPGVLVDAVDVLPELDE